MEIKNQLYTQTQPKLLLGKGSYGEVTLRHKDGNKLAIKSATEFSIASAQAIENEINILTSLSSSSSSPYIASYYGKEETPSGKSLLMEYVSGGDLSKRGRIDDVEVIRAYTWCLAEALRVVHREGFVHCDVKASNVLVDGGSDGGVVKLADFGSSKKLLNDEANCVLPRGSPLWMAPEVVRGEEQGFAADVWSLGCTVIEMLTGKPAWRDEGLATLIKIGYSGSLPELPEELPELAKDFLDKCLVREVGQRWSCKELVRHPFLIPVTRKLGVEVSPTSVLNWDEVDFPDVDGDVIEFREYQDSGVARVAELSTVLVANWESDDWIDVRSSVVNLEIPCNYNVESTWINFDVEIINGEDGGLICGKLTGIEKNNKNVMVELLLFNSMGSKLYSSCTSIGLLLNVNRKMLLLPNLIKVPRFWIKVHFSNFFDNRLYFSTLLLLLSFLHCAIRVTLSTLFNLTHLLLLNKQSCIYN